jgi:hypothetical protein
MRPREEKKDRLEKLQSKAMEGSIELVSFELV